MGYKSELQSNNTDLQSILDMILALGLVDKPKATFSVDEINYEFYEGMTFEEYINSELNTTGFSSKSWRFGSDDNRLVACIPYVEGGETYQVPVYYANEDTLRPTTIDTKIEVNHNYFALTKG